MPPWTSSARLLARSARFRPTKLGALPATRPWHARPLHQTSDGLDLSARQSHKRSHNPWGLPSASSNDSKENRASDRENVESTEFSSLPTSNEPESSEGRSQEEADTQSQEEADTRSEEEANIQYDPHSDHLRAVSPNELELAETVEAPGPEEIDAAIEKEDSQANFKPLSDPFDGSGEPSSIRTWLDEVRERTWVQTCRQILSAHEQSSFEDVFNINMDLLRDHYLIDTTEDSRVENVAILDGRTVHWVEDALEQMQAEEAAVNLGELAERWAVDAMLLWSNVCLWFLTYEPTMAARFLASTASWEPPERFVLQATRMIIRAYDSLYPPTAVKPGVDSLVDMCVWLSARPASLADDTFPRTVSFMLENCEDAPLMRLYETLHSHNLGLTSGYYLQCANSFAERELFEPSLDALLRSGSGVAAQADLHHDFWATFRAVLRHCKAHPDSLRLSLRVVDEMAKAGFTLRNDTRNTLMLNAVEAGDINTVFSVYRSTVDELRPTAVTYHILLLACQANIDDAVTLNETVRNAIMHCDIRKSPLLADTLLHVSALHHFRASPDTAWQTLVEICSELYESAPFEAIHLPVPPRDPSSDAFSKKMEPSHYTVGIMTRNYIAHVIHTKMDTEKLVPIYKQWRQLAEAGWERHLTQLLVTDQMCNGFLIGFGSSKETLAQAVQVMREMQNPRMTPALESAGIVPSPPTTKSWNILLHAFLTHELFDMAEQILTRMIAGGVEPGVDTYNTFINAYASAQDLPRLVTAVTRLNKSQLPWNDIVYNTLRKFKDQEHLKQALGEVPDWETTLSFEKELKEKLSERVQGAGGDGDDDGER